MNAVLIIEFEPWHPSPIYHQPEKEWYRQGTCRILFVKSDTFTEKDYLKLDESEKAKSVIEGTVTEITLDAIGFVSGTVSIPVNRNNSIKNETLINKTNYNETAASFYQNIVNTMLQQLRVSYNINMTLMIDR